MLLKVLSLVSLNVRNLALVAAWPLRLLHTPRFQSLFLHYQQSVVCFTRGCLNSASSNNTNGYSRSILLPIPYLWYWIVQPFCYFYGSHFVGWYKDGVILPCRISCHNHLSDPILPQTSLSYTSHPCTVPCHARPTLDCSSIIILTVVLK